MSASGEPLVSVVVPTRDRPNPLARCLAALEAQTAHESTEIVVVDDGSRDASAVESVIAGRPRIRLLRQSGAGPAAARNSGIREARGRYVCLTDDDCEPWPDWVEHMIGSLREGAAVTAGRTLNGGPGNPFDEASELIGTALSTTAANGGAGIAFARSNNLASGKDLLAKIPFDESYPDAAGEDRAWCARVTAAGYALHSEPAACVVHHQELTFRSFLRQQVRYGQGAFRFRRRGPEPRPLEPAAFYAGLLRRAFVQGFRVGLLVAAAQAATTVGFVCAWVSQRRDGPSVSARSGPSTSRRGGS